jgi:hypothetical protein
MAIIKRRYLYKGPWPLPLRGATDQALTLPNPKFVLPYDVQWDDAISPIAAMDEQMKHYGCFPEPVDTFGLSPDPFLGIISPDGSIWKLSVSDLGVLTVVNVSI